MSDKSEWGIQGVSTMAPWRTAHLLIWSCLVLSAAQGQAEAQGVYIDQMDRNDGVRPGSTETSSMYIEQMSPTARPRTPRQTNRQKKAAQKLVRALVNRSLPDVGGGVSLAVPPSELDSSFPSVGKGTVSG